jgi:hypothetical protein
MELSGSPGKRLEAQLANQEACPQDIGIDRECGIIEKLNRVFSVLYRVDSLGLLVTFHDL